MSVTGAALADRLGRRLLRRLGRPGGGAAVVWVPLAAIVCGLFTGALASRAAWETSRPQPDRAEASAVLTEVFPGHDLGEIDTPPALFVVYGHALRLNTVKTLLFGDGGEYQESATGAAAFGTPPVPADQIVATARERLTGAGWRVYDPQVSDRVSCADKFCATPQAVTDTALTARRGDTILNASISSQSAVDATYLSVELHRAPPSLVVPAGVLGTLLGAVAAWVVFGWVGRRTEGRRRRSAVSALVGVATVLWWLPVLLSVPFLLSHHLGEPHPAWHPYWEWLGQPTASLLFLVGAVCVSLALGLAAVTRHPGRQTREAGPAAPSGRPSS
jgi:hypothetical protein